MPTFTVPTPMPPTTNVPTAYKPHAVWLKTDVADPTPTLSALAHDPGAGVPVTNPDIITYANIVSVTESMSYDGSGKTIFESTIVVDLPDTNAKIGELWTFMEDKEIDHTTHTVAFAMRMTDDTGRAITAYPTMTQFAPSAGEDKKTIYTIGLRATSSLWNYIAAA